MLTGITNSSWIELVFVGSKDFQVIEDGNEVNCLDIVNNDIQGVDYGIVGSNRQQPSDVDSVSVIVTGFWKTVPNHTFVFQYIYHCNMKSIAFPIIFHSTTRNSMLNYVRNTL